MDHTQTDYEPQEHWRSISILPCTSVFEKENPNEAIQLYEQTLLKYPNSYKLWHAYLLHRVKLLNDKQQCNDDDDDSLFEETITCFERALVTMHKMPRIWIEYNSLLIKQKFITRTRRNLNRTLESLPITQHFRIWPLFLEFVKQDFVPVETGIRVFKRYVQLQPQDTEDYIDYLIEKKKFNEAAYQLYNIINARKFASKRNKTNYQLWEDLCDLISEYGEQIDSINIDAILRDAIKRYRDQQGKLWNTLAKYYIHLGLFERARSVFEEGIRVVTTKKDFAEIWDAYSKSEEEYLGYLLSEDRELTEDELIDLDIRQAAYENLINRRELMLNSVALAQNPHNVKEWQKRVRLFDDLHNFIDEDDDDNEDGDSNTHKDVYTDEKFAQLVKSKLDTYADAIKTVDPKQATGNYENLWIEYALFYDKLNDIKNVRATFEEAIKTEFAKIDELTNVWCAYIEFELKQYLLMSKEQQLTSDEKPASICKTLVARAVTQRQQASSWSDTDAKQQSVHSKLYKSLKLWLLYADIEENFGSFESTKAVYDRILDLKIATPQVVLNYAKLLEEHSYFEHSFRVFEKGTSLFKWPYVQPIWTTYLTKHLLYTSQFNSKKLDRNRDIFEQCLRQCPPNYCKEIYIAYAKLELEYGLLSRVADIFIRATQNVESNQKANVCRTFIRSMMNKTTINSIRKYYEFAISTLDNKGARNFSLEYAKLETELQEIERARTIYSHCSQMCDPEVDSEFWNCWREFEMKFGDEDTITEMLRIKRSTQILFATTNLQSTNLLQFAVSEVDDEQPPLELTSNE